MVVLASPRDLSVLYESTDLLCDGTFDYAPQGFAQLYAIMGFVNGEAVPAAVGLLPNKRRETYNQMFRVLRVSSTL